MRGFFYKLIFRNKIEEKINNDEKEIKTTVIVLEIFLLST